MPDTSLVSPHAATARRRDFLINLLFAAAVIGLVVVIVRYVLLWALPFVLAAITAAAIQHPLRWLVKHTGGDRRFLSVLLVVALVLLLGGVIAAVGWQLITAVTEFFADADRVQATQQALQAWTQRWQTALAAWGADSAQVIVQAVSDSLLTAASELLTAAASGAVTFTATKLPSWLLAFVVWLAASLFLSMDYRRVTAFVRRQLPLRWLPIVRSLRTVCTRTLFKLVRAYGVLMLITFAELSVGLLLLGVPHALLIAAAVAVVDILPVLGTGTVLIPWAVVAWMMGNARLGIGLAVLYAIITVARNLLEPRLVSRQIGLSPLVTLLCMYVGLRACGVLGLVLFPVGLLLLKQLQDDGQLRLWK